MSDPVGSIHRDAVLVARRTGRDPRGSLLRLLVARYLASSASSETEQARFSALAKRLFDTVDLATARRAVAELATSPKTPFALALHLARGPIALAAPILRLSPVLDDVALMALADTTSAAHAASIAARRDVSPLLAKKLATAFHEARGAVQIEAGTVLRDLREDEAPDAVTASRPPQSPVPAPPSRPAGDLSLLRGDGFFSATPEQRAVLFDHIGTWPPLPLSQRAPLASRALLANLEQAALKHQPAVFATLLEQALAISAANAAAIVEDRSGEALVIACRTLGMTFEVVARVLLFLNPAIGQSVARVFALAHLFEELSDASAQHIVHGWRTDARRDTTMPAEEALSMRGFAQKRRSSAGPAGEITERRRG